MHGERVIITFHENRSNGSRVVPRGRNDMTKLSAELRTHLKKLSTFYTQERNIYSLMKIRR
jgi:hypothetical protein